MKTCKHCGYERKRQGKKGAPKCGFVRTSLLTRLQRAWRAFKKEPLEYKPRKKEAPIDSNH